MGQLYLLVALACVSGLALGQDSQPTSVPQASPSASPASDDKTPNTRFFPGFEELDVLGIFHDPCDKCSFHDQETAHRCCQSHKRHCCSFLQPIGGGPFGPFGPPVGPPVGPPHPGHFHGGFGGPFTGHVGPPGIPGQVGGNKPGTCPFVAGAQSFNRFAGGASCVQECQSDFQCSGIQKCCPVGCSTVCRSPPGAHQGFGQPTTKPGFCPRKTGFLGGLFGTRSAASPGGLRSAADAPSDDPSSVSPENDAETQALKEKRKELRQQARREQRQEERQGGERTRRSPQRDVQERNRERRRNRFSRVYNRVTRDADDQEVLERSRRSPQRDIQERNRERRRNRFSRVYNRVTRDIDDQEVLERSRRSPQRDIQEIRREVRRNRFSRIFRRVTRQVPEDPNQRFFLPKVPKIPNIFCRDECFNDFDCPGNLKCCSEDDCRRCLNPSF